LEVVTRHHPHRGSLAAQVNNAAVRPANYNYRQLLTEYRGPLSSLFSQIDGLVTTDIDEALNRIVVGVLTQWSTENSQAFQGGSYFGHEIGDPAGFTDPSLCGSHVCRYSDGSVFEYSYDSIPALDGNVAYPADTASVTFSSYVAMLDTPAPYDSETVHMIGRLSGRRRGKVLATCVDVWNISGWGNRKMLCQVKASYFSQGGDSGAPVIVLYSPTTGGALGLHWGNQTSNGIWQYSWFSTMYGALSEFFYGMPGSPNFSPVVY
jgi:hypothetical protein